MNYTAAMPKHTLPAIEKLAVFADFDGTLVELAPAPDSVIVDPRTHALLGEIITRTDGAFAIISGRRIVDLDHLLAPLRFPVCGCYGAEIRLRIGDAVEPLTEPMPPELVQRLCSFAARIPGILFEDKIYGICLHFHEDIRVHDTFAKEWPAIESELGEGLHVHIHNRGCEIKREGFHKGHAVKQFLAAPDFQNRMPVYIGDDVLDRKAFAEVRAAGGLAISVGKNNIFPETSFVLPSVAAVHAWLGGLVGQ